MWKRRLNRLSLTFLAAAGLAACGGGSGDGSSMSVEEQAAVAAESGATTVAAAQSFTASQTSYSSGSSSSSTSGAITQAESGLGCGSGSGFTDDAAGLDITNKDFPDSAFSNEIQLPNGSDSSTELRAENCVITVTSTNVTTTTEIDGASDKLARKGLGNSGSGEARVQLLGDYQGDNEPPDLSANFDTKVSQDGTTTLDFSARGTIYSCDGCLKGDLGNFAGTPGRDQTVAMFLEAKIGDSTNSYQFTFGSSRQNPLVFQTAVVSSDVTSVAIDGSVDFSAGSGCDFSATYNTVSPLQVENYQMSSSTITGGKLEVTVDGSTKTVTFDSSGTVKVDGNAVDTSSINADCNAFDDVSAS